MKLPRNSLRHCRSKMFRIRRLLFPLSILSSLRCRSQVKFFFQGSRNIFMWACVMVIHRQSPSYCCFHSSLVERERLNSVCVCVCSTFVTIGDKAAVREVTLVSHYTIKKFTPAERYFTRRTSLQASCYNQGHHATLLGISSTNAAIPEGF